MMGFEVIIWWLVHLRVFTYLTYTGMLSELVLKLKTNFDININLEERSLLGLSRVTSLRKSA